MGKQGARRWGEQEVRLRAESEKPWPLEEVESASGFSESRRFRLKKGRGEKPGGAQVERELGSPGGQGQAAPLQQGACVLGGPVRSGT